MAELVQLRALGWDHPRCMDPIEACTREWSRLHPQIAISWEVRSLAGFGDQPLEEVASEYDLLTIDHPFCGAAEVAGILRPLDELLSPGQLATLRGDSIGQSHDSYAFNGHQWAVAVDAACQVSAMRTDLLERGAPGHVGRGACSSSRTCSTSRLAVGSRACDLELSDPVRKRRVTAGLRPGAAGTKRDRRVGP